jgi:uncharacterized protein YndB with AHSA1/START domain
MATPNTGSEIALRLERSIAAPPAKVFEAWTRAEPLTLWFAPSPDFKAIVHALEPRAGGVYRIEMKSPDGDSSTVTGTFREVIAPSRLVFTWKWDRPGAEETLVTVAIQPEGAGSRLVLLHERFSSTDERDKHNQGWTGCLSRLPKVV